jgi:hypothetical protein
MIFPYKVRFFKQDQQFGMKEYASTFIESRDNKSHTSGQNQNSYMVWAGTLNDLKETSCNGGGDN